MFHYNFKIDFIAHNIRRCWLFSIVVSVFPPKRPNSSQQ